MRPWHNDIRTKISTQLKLSTAYRNKHNVILKTLFSQTTTNRTIWQICVYMAIIASGLQEITLRQTMKFLLFASEQRICFIYECLECKILLKLIIRQD